MVHLIFTASYTNEISTLAFDPDTASLAVSSTVTVGHHPSWLTCHPDDRSLVFTGLEQSDGKIIALKFDKEGKGKIVAKEVPSGGADPCTLLATKDTLYIGNVSPIFTAIDKSVMYALQKVLFRHCIYSSYFLESALYTGLLSKFNSVHGLGAQPFQAGGIASTPSNYHRGI